MRELVIATFNLKKGREMQTILGELLRDTRLLTLQEFPQAIEPEETGTTYEENAAIKALSACGATNRYSISDDAGLEIDFLDGAPGVYSKRFGGEDLPFAKKNAMILDLMRDVPDEKRLARFRCYIALASLGGELKSFHAVCEGRIAREVSGSGGFGFDPIFYLPQLQCTMADLSSEQKHATSHRGKVLTYFANYWNESTSELE